MNEELDIRITLPETFVCSVRLNREELRTITRAARFHGMKLSTYIKQQALHEASLPQVLVRWAGRVEEVAK